MNQTPDIKPGNFYVDVVREDGEYRLLAGPFVNDHASALEALPAVKALALELDPRAAWYSFGTCRTDEYSGAGILNGWLSEPL